MVKALPSAEIQVSFHLHMSSTKQLQLINVHYCIIKMYCSRFPFSFVQLLTVLTQKVILAVVQFFSVAVKCIAFGTLIYPKGVTGIFFSGQINS